MDAEQRRACDRALRAAGHAPGEVIGAGMEGTVVALEDGLVAKVWHRRTVAELRTLQSFYAAVSGAGIPLATPVVHDILELGSQAATVEDRLPGRPLARGSVAAVVDVLAALAAVPPAPAMAALPVLESEQPFDAATPFPRSLAQLVERRAARHDGPLSARVTGRALAAACIARLEALAVGQVGGGLVHGDLIPENVLVDDADRPVAVLDFGFLSTVGDPAFDAAVAASVHDMYGPRARALEAQVDAAVAERFGHDPRRLALYRAAYALATSNCFSASGSDGHFEWCAQMLERDDVREALSD